MLTRGVVPRRDGEAESVRSLGELNVEFLADFSRVEIDAGFAGRFARRSAQKGGFVIFIVVAVVAVDVVDVYFDDGLGPDFGRNGRRFGSAGSNVNSLFFFVLYNVERS